MRAAQVIQCALRCAKPQATVRGVLGATGPTDIRARCTKFEPTSLPEAGLQNLAQRLPASRVALKGGLLADWLMFVAICTNWALL